MERERGGGGRGRGRDGLKEGDRVYLTRTLQPRRCSLNVYTYTYMYM